MEEEEEEEEVEVEEGGGQGRRGQPRVTALSLFVHRGPSSVYLSSPLSSIPSPPPLLVSLPSAQSQGRFCQESLRFGRLNISTKQVDSLLCLRKNATKLALFSAASI